MNKHYKTNITALIESHVDCLSYDAMLEILSLVLSRRAYSTKGFDIEQKFIMVNLSADKLVDYFSDYVKDRQRRPVAGNLVYINDYKKNHS